MKRVKERNAGEDGYSGELCRLGLRVSVGDVHNMIPKAYDTMMVYNDGRYRGGTSETGQGRGRDEVDEIEKSETARTDGVRCSDVTQDAKQQGLMAAQKGPRRRVGYLRYHVDRRDSAVSALAALTSRWSLRV